MYVVILTTLFALTFSYLASKNRVKYGLDIAFLAVTFIQAIHYKYGNDYLGYYDDYRMITSNTFNWDDLLAGNFWKEPGWALINFFFARYGGFYMMVAVLSVVYNFIYYKLIRTFLPRNLWLFGVFVYLFSCYDLYLINMSMMRQGLSIALFAYSFQFIIRKDIIRSAILVFIAYSIHSSAVILIPFVFIGFLNVERGKLIVFTFLALFFIFFISTQVMSSLMDQLRVIALFETYSHDYIETGDTDSFGFGFMLRLIPFFVYMYVLAYKNKKLENYQKYAIILAASNFLVEPFASLGVMVVRMGYYFNAISIIAIPVAFSVLDKKFKIILLQLYMVLMIYMYYSFFDSSAYAKYYRDFHSIFEII